MRISDWSSDVCSSDLATPAAAQATPDCDDGTCRIQLTPQQLQAAAERLVHARRFDEAAPLVAALRQAPGFAMQSRFLTGYIAAETGHPDRAAAPYRAILTDDQGQTGVRLELPKPTTGRASCRERGCPYVSIWGGAVS